MEEPLLPDASAALGEDAPIACEACLGPNPYMQMIRLRNNAECKLSNKPFHAFRWKTNNNRFKETIVAPHVAREKNICQVCLNDLKLKVPYHVKEHVMHALQSTQDLRPESDVNKEYYWENKRQEQGDMAHLASNSDNITLQANLQTLKVFANLDPGPVVRVKRQLTPEQDAALREKRLAELRPPADASVTTLFIGSVPPACHKEHLLSIFREYGNIANLEMRPNQLCGFVTFEKRADAERACRALQGKMQFRSTRMRLSWARKKKDGDATSGKHKRERWDECEERAATKAGSTPLPLPPGIPLPPGVSKRNRLDV